MCGGGQGFERVDSGCCEACQGVDWRLSRSGRGGGKAEAVKAAMRVILEAVAGSFVIPQSTRWQAAGRALRDFAALVPAGGLMMESRAQKRGP